MNLPTFARMIIFIIGTSSCSTQTFNIQSSRGGLEKDKQQNFFISGIGQEQEVDAAKICDGIENVVKVQTELSAENILASIVSFGIYTPRQARVFCKGTPIRNPLPSAPQKTYKQKRGNKQKPLKTWEDWNL